MCTDRLSINELEVGDAAELFVATESPEVGEFIGGAYSPSVQALGDRIERMRAGSGRADESWLNYSVRVTDTGDLIGHLQASVHSEWAEVAWVFGRPWWGYGYAAEAVTWLIESLPSVELWATVDPGNARSLRLLVRLGFTETTVPPARDVQSYDDGDRVFVRMPV
ncbi:MAG: GNAT family N-acetyltransferase [Actinomycetes bacterium]